MRGRTVQQAGARIGLALGRVDQSDVTVNRPSCWADSRVKQRLPRRIGRPWISVGASRGLHDVFFVPLVEVGVGRRVGRRDAQHCSLGPKQLIATRPAEADASREPRGFAVHLSFERWVFKSRPLVLAERFSVCVVRAEPDAGVAQAMEQQRWRQRRGGQCGEFGRALGRRNERNATGAEFKGVGVPPRCLEQQRAPRGAAWGEQPAAEGQVRMPRLHEGDRAGKPRNVG
mmetsp:Transcript_3139/g.10509  ORF Transcript_3139/g.10509 Transcript_3139/m.10509 type:complete len:230 (+) Transcript_3139:450-1139(+)